MVQINFAGKTDVGRKRTNNEDVFVIEPDLGFCLVADGLGGAAAGEVASQIFSEVVVAVFQNAINQPVADVAKKVQISFLMANEAIINNVKENPARKGMSCTAELFAFNDEEFVLGHLGDSRTYRFRDGRLRRLTHDHSFVQDQIDKGLISPENARNHPLRNVINKAVGIDEQIELDIVKSKFMPQDQYLLCSDGLTDMVDDQSISEVLELAMPAEKKVDRLIELALSGGGKDNITVVHINIAGS